MQTPKNSKYRAEWVSYRPVKNKKNWDIYLFYINDKQNVVKSNLKEMEALQGAMKMNQELKAFIKEHGKDTYI
jgi:hypothetical protein